MMKKTSIKKLLVSAMAVLCIGSNFSTTALANTGVTGVHVPSIEEQLAQMTPEQRQQYQEKVEASKRMAEQLKQRAGSPRANDMKVLPGFTTYAQEKRNYCVPASVYGALRYINNSSPSQSSIADTLKISGQGTKFDDDILVYLGKKQTRNPYALAQGGWKELTVSQLKTTLDSYNAVPLFCANVTRINNWQYDLWGSPHVVNIIGSTSDGEQFMISDPYAYWASMDNNTYIPDQYSIDATHLEYSKIAYIW